MRLTAAELIWKYIKMNFKAAAEFRLDFFSNIAMVFNDFILFGAILYLAYTNNGISIFSSNEVLMAITILQLSFVFAVDIFRGVEDFDFMVIKGDLDKLLIRPVNPYWHTLVHRINNAFFGELIIGLLLIFMNRPENIPFILFFSITSGLIIHFSLFTWNLMPLFFEQNENQASFDITINFAFYPPTIYGTFMKTLGLFIFPGGMASFGPLLISKYPNFAFVYFGFIVFQIILFFNLFNLGLKKYKSAGY